MREMKRKGEESRRGVEERKEGEKIRNSELI